MHRYIINAPYVTENKNIELVIQVYYDIDTSSTRLNNIIRELECTI